MMLHRLHWHPPGACWLPWIINQRITALSGPQYMFWEATHNVDGTPRRVPNCPDKFFAPYLFLFFSRLIKIVLLRSKNPVNDAAFGFFRRLFFFWILLLGEAAVCYENKFLSFPFSSSPPVFSLCSRTLAVGCKCSFTEFSTLYSVRWGEGEIMHLKASFFS